MMPIGTTIRASVHIKLPKISKNLDEFNKIAARYNLQVRGTAGEHSETVGGIYDVSNKVCPVKKKISTKKIPENQVIFNQSINSSINQSINQLLTELLNQSINQSINQLINSSINQSIDSSINQSITHWITESINQSINQSIRF